MVRVADYFNVSVDYLLTGEQKRPTQEGDPDEAHLLTLWRNATNEGKQAAVVLLKGFQKEKPGKNCRCDSQLIYFNFAQKKQARHIGQAKIISNRFGYRASMFQEPT